MENILNIIILSKDIILDNAEETHKCPHFKGNKQRP